jgi:sugar phosphate isomerase/epimerase
MKTQTKRHDYKFKIGVYLNELRLPFQESLAVSKDIGAEYVWFSRVSEWDEFPETVVELSDKQVQFIGDTVRQHGLTMSLIAAESPFKHIQLIDLDYEDIEYHPIFKKELEDIFRSMEIASALGIGAVNVHAFCWPGEYSGKPTWPMRWLSRGGLICDSLDGVDGPSEMDKLLKAFSLVLDGAEKHNVDVVLSMLPWHYTNTTNNFRHFAERLSSKRIKAIWGPADGLTSGEADVATTGFNNIRPYLHSLHLKDLHVIDGLKLNFEYKPIGEGDTDYQTILQSMLDNSTDAVLAVAAHFKTASGLGADAIKMNCKNIQDIISKLEYD